MNNKLTKLIVYGRKNKWWRKGYCFMYLCEKYIFKNTDIKNKNILDIGAGRGEYSLWCATKDATKVVAIEPSLAGSKKNSNIASMLDAQLDLGLDNMEIKPVPFQSYDIAELTFDLILLKSTVNHLSEDSCMAIQYNDDAKNEFIYIFKKLKRLLNKDGVVIITDCSDRNFFGDLGIKNPFAPSIEWNIHQSPEVWADLLQEAGFKDVAISWIPPAYLMGIGVLFSNKYLAYFLNSVFRIEAKL